MMIKQFFLTLIILLSVSDSFSQIDVLKNKIDSIISNKRAVIGAAIISEDGKELVSVNGDKEFPMQSVYKFHLAIAVLDLVEKGKFNLNDKILITKSDMLEYYSPLRDKYPEGNIEISIGELISYAVSLSDNVACDVLFRLVGGTSAVNDFIHSKGINRISIFATEEEMLSAWDVQYKNWSTPIDAARLLNKLKNKEILSSTYDFLWDVMVKTSTGPKRIKGLLPDGTIVAHKTGTGPENSDGMTGAINDIGIVVMPDGYSFSVAVFVSNTYETLETNESVIAGISKLAYDYFETVRRK